jgi:nicotinamide phosphoribosyltransferase
VNPLLLIDGYKLDHRRQYPAGTTRVYSNWTPRSSRVEGVDRVVFFGLQYFLQKYLCEEMESWFKRPTQDVCDEYKTLVDRYLGPNAIGTDHVRALHRLGHVPLEFRALPEGTRCPLRVPMLTVENTHDDFAWLVNYVETLMSNVLWLPCTSATSAHRLRAMLDEAARLTGGDPDFVPWQGHDFSMRGMAGVEAAQLSGAAHLLSFTGTDTLPALPFVDEYYGGQPHYIEGNGLVGGSVPATEHSVMSAGGEEGERETFERLLSLYPTGIVSVVSDTWDLWSVLTETLPSLKAKIMARDGKLVIRPDSGDPVKILCGDDYAAVTGQTVSAGPAIKGVVQLLWDVFGGTRTSTGHRQLDSHVGVIYGDAITYERAREIVERLGAAGFASTNVVFGVGSYTYQHVTRDTFGFAMKATWAMVGGESRDLYKKPATDDGTKHSARGRLAVLKSPESGKLVLCDQLPADSSHSLLKPVWRDGCFLRTQTFANVRETLRGQS